MVPAAIVCSTTSTTLPDILPALHAAGFGSMARVVRPGRISAMQQIARIGLRTNDAPPRIEQADALIVVLAAGRAATAAKVVHGHGASATWIVGLRGEWQLHDDGFLEDAAASSVPQPEMLPSGASIGPMD